MDLHVLPSADARDFRPDRPSYGIRIASPAYPGDIVTLNESPLWVHVADYFFSDTWPQMMAAGKRLGLDQTREVLFTDEMADGLVLEFDRYRAHCEALVVNCTRGINRSPAVAIALNEAFELGHDTTSLKNQYKESNWHVYRKVLEAGRRII